MCANGSACGEINDGYAACVTVTFTWWVWISGTEQAPGPWKCSNWWPAELQCCTAKWWGLFSEVHPQRGTTDHWALWPQGRLQRFTGYCKGISMGWGLGLPLFSV